MKRLTNEQEAKLSQAVSEAIHAFTEKEFGSGYAKLIKNEAYMNSIAVVMFGTVLVDTYLLECAVDIRGTLDTALGEMRGAASSLAKMKAEIMAKSEEPN